MDAAAHQAGRTKWTQVQLGVNAVGMGKEERERQTDSEDLSVPALSGEGLLQQSLIKQLS